jgi:hypothetical protein
MGPGFDAFRNIESLSLGKAVAESGVFYLLQKSERDLIN